MESVSTRTALTGDESDVSDDEDSDEDDNNDVSDDDISSASQDGLDDNDTLQLAELNTYLSGKQLDDTPDFDVLAWWWARREEFPCLNKMMRQFLASPASSAGIERLFNGAGKMHGDDCQNMKSECISNSLFVSENYDPWSFWHVNA